MSQYKRKAKDLTNSNYQFQQLPDEAFIRQQQLMNLYIVPFSAATLWRRVKAGQFPKPIKLSEQITAWRVSDIRKWLANPYEFGRVDQKGVV